MHHFLHLGVTLVFSIEIILSFMEGEMDVVVDDLSPIEKEMDASLFV